jgi:ketosteroid isomerase-like protein
MLKFSGPTIIAICSFFVFSCNANTEKATGEKTENAELDKQWAKSFIDSTNTKFSEQIAAGDSTALASHYWPDAEILLDNSDPVRGNDIVKAWGYTIRAGIKEMNFVTTDITGNSSFIIETGSYEMKGNNKKLVDKGKYVVVWEKRNGEWKLYRDIGSTSMPAK